MKIILSLLFNCLCIKIVAQSIQPLGIGDEVPNLQFEMTSMDGKQSKIRLAELRGRVVILDFWATTCDGCVKAFPRMDTFQKLYNDKLEVILVNPKVSLDNKVKVASLFSKVKAKFPGFNLRYTVEDTIASAYFPFTDIPHYVWIGVDGRVKAITGSSEVTEGNIVSIINNRAIALKEKIDFQPDKPLYLGGVENWNFVDYESYSLFRRGRINGLESLNRGRYLTPKNISFEPGSLLPRGRAFRNLPLMELYRTAFNNAEEKRFVLEVQDVSSLRFDYSNKTKEQWEVDNLYTYDVLISEDEMRNNSWQKQMIQDLNRLSGYTITPEERLTKCLVLVWTSKVDKFKSKGGRNLFEFDDKSGVTISGSYFKRIIGKLNSRPFSKLLIIDETSYDGKVDLVFPAYPNSLVELREILNQYDLDIIETERKLEMLVIRDRK